MMVTTMATIMDTVNRKIKDRHGAGSEEAAIVTEGSRGWHGGPYQWSGRVRARPGKHNSVLSKRHNRHGGVFVVVAGAL